jgi:LmbE family N-acetylglucosaminyl deacetylase
MPVTNLAAKPAIRRLFPELAGIVLPLGGIYLADRSRLDIETMSDNWAFDLEVLFRAHLGGWGIQQIDLGEVLDTVKPISAYHEMAAQVLSYLIDLSRGVSNERLLFVMAHADDVEIWAGGTLLKYLAAGARATVVILCGDETRKGEAATLWAGQPRLDLVLLGEDEFVSGNRPAAVAVRDIALQFRPTLAITHQPDDVHGDHRRCFDVLTAALLMLPRATLPRRILTCNGYFERGRPPGSFRPDIFIDITAEAEAKYRAIGHYVSQDTAFWIDMARHLDDANGFRCGVRAAEAFQTYPFFHTPSSSAVIP